MKEEKVTPKSIKAISWIMYFLSLASIIYAMAPYISELIVYLIFLYHNAEYYGLQGVYSFSLLGLTESLSLIVIAVTLFYLGRKLSEGKNLARIATIIVFCSGALLILISLLNYCYGFNFLHLNRFYLYYFLNFFLFILFIFIFIYLIFSKKSKEFFSKPN